MYLIFISVLHIDDIESQNWLTLEGATQGDFFHYKTNGCHRIFFCYISCSHTTPY